MRIISVISLEMVMRLNLTEQIEKATNFIALRFLVDKTNCASLILGHDKIYLLLQVTGGELRR